MQRAVFSDTITKLATVEQARERYKLGRKTIMKIASGANAVRKIGRSVRIDIEKMDQAIEKL